MEQNTYKNIKLSARKNNTNIEINLSKIFPLFSKPVIRIKVLPITVRDRYSTT